MAWHSDGLYMYLPFSHWHPWSSWCSPPSLLVCSRFYSLCSAVCPSIVGFLPVPDACHLPYWAVQGSLLTGFVPLSNWSVCSAYTSLWWWRQSWYSSFWAETLKLWPCFFFVCLVLGRGEFQGTFSLLFVVFLKRHLLMYHMFLCQDFEHFFLQCICFHWFSCWVICPSQSFHFSWWSVSTL